jgi:DNA (cytosine-5)-methyltransferase 1
MRAAVVDLFCGVGALTYGFKQEGFDVRGGIDTDESCRFAFQQNLRAAFLNNDIRRVPASRLNAWFAGHESSYRVLIGCAPCAPFSIYTGRYRKKKRRDRHRKWELLREFARLAVAVKPDVISMENVPRLQRHRIFKKFVAVLRDNGYVVTYSTVKAYRYGVPQRRSRLVLFASRFGPIAMLPTTHEKPVTVRDAIGDLHTIKDS